MKSIIAVAAMASASAVAPPRIELDLSQMPTSQVSHQDWTETCQAGAEFQNDRVACPYPVAKAYDHQDQEVDVVTKIYQVDKEGEPSNTLVTAPDFSVRSTYMMKFTASDSAGNKAAEVVFALILNDVQKPTIRSCPRPLRSFESGVVVTTEPMCTTVAATKANNLDTSSTLRISYTLTRVPKVGMGNPVTMAQTTDVTVINRYLVFTDASNKKRYRKGDFVVDITVTDNAGLYGENNQDNTATAQVAIKMQDTTSPELSVLSDSPAYQECAVTYSDAGAHVYDEYDSNKGNNITVHTTSNVDTSVVDKYPVTYSARDSSNNEATPKRRMVHVVDNTKPNITLTGDRVIVHRANTSFSDPGVQVADTCDKNLPAVQMSWNGKPFDDTVTGSYNRTYSITDASNNTNSVVRTFTVIDKGAPIITLQGADVEVVEASVTDEYTDKGAVCTDYVDGVLSNAVEVSGMIVNMRKPGKYMVYYDCQDFSGNDAIQRQRTVYVRDTGCPQIKLKGSEINFVEAAFPYVDAGATAYDSLDGNITDRITKDGDTVNTAQAFYQRDSCKSIKYHFPAGESPNTGEYFITRYSRSLASFQRVLVWCNFDNGAADTYHPIVGGAQINSDASTATACTSIGMDLAYQFASNAAKSAVCAKFGNAMTICNSEYNNVVTETTNYICTLNDQNVDVNAVMGNNGAHNTIMRAEAGKYVIFYHVKDSSNNTECETVKRTVVVKDTMPPVITLHLKGVRVATSDASATGIGGMTNPAGTAAGNPFIESASASLMAEQPTSTLSNGWVLAAASAVTGLALLAYAGRKANRQTTSVPV